MRLRISCQSPLVKLREQHRCAHRFTQPAHVTTIKLDGAARAGKSGLAWRDLIAIQIDGRQSRHGHSAGRNIAAAMRYFETETINDLIALHLMDPDQRRLLILIGNGLSRSNA